ncbi:MAG: Mov34/MPN/PAD-1 family protein [Nitrospirae bacterium]|nr:Mov34/MPN/PAD-1 family protein [Nitrospirota bacterium]
MGKRGTAKERRSSDPADKPPAPVQEAFRLIASHRAIVADSVKSPVLIKKGIYRIEAVIEVPLPSRVRNKGISKTGVKAREPIILDFPKEYPFLSPTVRLRKDFNRSLPHINPGSPDSYVRPCIFEGDINELLHQENGIYGILDQLSDWLRKAAADQLIDPKQGWEPIRRDDFHGVLCFDADKLRGYVSRDEGFVTFLCGFRSIPAYFMGFVLENEISKHIIYKAKKVGVKTQDGITGGVTMGILSWPPAFNTDKTPLTTDAYLPETVMTLRDLLDRAKSYGNYKSLNERIQEIYLQIRQEKGDVPDGFMLVVILCARRPFNLIKEDSNLELIPYLIKCKRANGPLLNIDPDSPVYWLGHRHRLSTSLLRRMSGSRKSAVNAPIIQIGCGSVGSKIVLHLSRAGHGPFTLIDNKLLSPHNAARHALIDINEFTVFNNKAVELKKAISIYPEARASTAIQDNVIGVLNDQQKTKEVFPKGAALIIDSTASLAVREAFAATDRDRLPIPVMQTTLYSNGECGVCCIEGASRNPRIDDIVNKLFDSCIDDKELAGKLLTAEGGVTRQAIGQGCDSYTMVIPDTMVSIFSSAMAERARQLLEIGISPKGELSVGLLSDDHLGLSWKKYEVGETVILRGENRWEIRLLDNVVLEMAKEAVKCGSIETGGVMMGRLSAARKCLTITRLLPAPPDSIRSASAFVLGTEGLRDTVQRTQRACNNLFCYVGTWHTHPLGGGPSSRDYAVMQRMKEMRLGAPAICLVWTPIGFHCVMDSGDFRI